MLNLLMVTGQPFPEWGNHLDARITHIDEPKDADEWARVIDGAYKDADALLTDLAPIWQPIGPDIRPIEFNGMNALNGAKRNALPAFLYTPFTSPVITNAAYRAGCNAVVNSYTYSLEHLKTVIHACVKDDSVWIDQAIDVDLLNQILSVTDKLLSKLNDSDIQLLLQIVTHDTYEEVSEILGLKITTVRNRASKIYQACKFKNKTQAYTYAIKLGIKGIT